MEDDDNSSHSGSDNWSNEKLNQLLNLYANEPDLWNTSYVASSEQRQEAYERLSQQLNSDVVVITRKIRHLRTYYLRQLAKAKQLEARSPGKVFTTRWRWFKKMDEFLRDHVSPRCNKQSSEMDEDETSCHSGSEKWSNERLNQLLDLYANEPDLWNTSYLASSEQRQEAFERLSEQLNCEVFEVMRKVRHLRTYYVKQLGKSKQFEACSPGRVFTTRWRWFRKMDEFLHDHISSRNPRQSFDDPGFVSSNFEINEESESLPTESPTHSHEESINEQRSSTPKRTRKSDVDTGVQFKLVKIDTDDTAVNCTGSPNNNSEADDRFGCHVAKKLKLIKGFQQKQFAKLQINNILFNAQHGLLNLPDPIVKSLAALDEDQILQDMPSH